MKEIDKNSIDYLINLLDSIDDMNDAKSYGVLHISIFGDYSGYVYKNTHESDNDNDYILEFRNRKEMFENIIEYAKDNGVEI